MPTRPRLGGVCPQGPRATNGGARTNGNVSREGDKERRAQDAGDGFRDERQASAHRGAPIAASGDEAAAVPTAAADPSAHRQETDTNGQETDQVATKRPGSDEAAAVPTAAADPSQCSAEESDGEHRGATPEKSGPVPARPAAQAMSGEGPPTDPVSPGGRPAPPPEGATTPAPRTAGPRS